MILLNTHQLYNQICELLPQFINHPGVNLDNPTYPGYPYYQFKWGERPTKCEKGKPLVYALIDGRTTSPNSNCGNIHTVSFSLGITQVVDSASEQACFYQFWNVLQELFGRDGTALIFDQQGITYAGETLDPPYTLGDIGIAQTEIFGSDTVRKIGGDCGFWTIEMLVRWSFYIATRNRKLNFKF